MKLQRISFAWLLATLIIVFFISLPVMAEQASAESADFTVNTIPEPSGFILLILAGFLLRRVRKAGICCVALIGLWHAMPVLHSYAVAPIVTNVTAQQQAWPLTDVDIYYDLFDADGDNLYVMVNISTNSGVTYQSITTNVTGDIGAGISTGEYKHIVWHAGIDLPQYSSSTVRIRITVDDEMVMIPAGSFIMGDTFNEGHSQEFPVHPVFVSAFWMDKFEVTKSKWKEVYNWAVTNGYIFDNPGMAKANHHPVNIVNWFDCVKWCNARSEKERRTPCYYTDTALTTMYKTGLINISNNWVNWEADGYRLPTEAEWEKAARGGSAGHRFPWTDADTITHSNANYYSTNEMYGIHMPYDVSPTRGPHPDYTAGGWPYTSPPGAFAPNGYGLYDMAGNVMELCWDRFSYIYYNSSPASDPRGPDYGSDRAQRGGGWDNMAFYTRCAARVGGNPFNALKDRGFRCVRR